MITARNDETGALAIESLLELARAAERDGDWNEALRQYEAAFARVPAEGDAARAADVLRWIGTVHRERGDLELASEVYEASRAIAELNGLEERRAAALNCQGIVAQFAGSPDLAYAHYVEARRIAEATHDEQLVALVDQNLGALATIRGDVPAAIENYGAALVRYQRLGDERSQVAALNNMGMAHIDVGELDRAGDCFQRALELCTALHDSFMLGYVQLNRAELFIRRQRFEDARDCCDHGFSIFSRIESKTGLAEAYKYYGMLYRETGKGNLAEIHLGLALNLSQAADNRLLQAEVYQELAQVHLDELRHREAITCLNRGHRLFRDMQAKREVVDIEQQLDRIEDAYLTVVQRWGTEAIETKDSYTLGHSQRVAEYTTLLGGALGIAGRELTWLCVGAFLHDVGKTVIPSNLLQKTGPLTAAEWELMKRHTIVGDEIVAGLDFPFDIRPMVRGHHERWNGTGYPDRLQGTEIPLQARILAVADVYDAMTTGRAYRSAVSAQDARSILRAESGRALDPGLVDVFLGVLEGAGA